MEDLRLFAALDRKIVAAYSVAIDSMADRRNLAYRNLADRDSNIVVPLIILNIISFFSI
jgi:hypothetical protein